jgi:DNA repair protein RecN (Recombination protein N)
MLRELHITNLALIADATVEFDRGLNCFTGQTGAGKSLMIGALELLLGLRSPQNMLRAGCTEARVTGIFQIADADLRRRLAALADAPLEDEPELILTRRVQENGRTSATLNGNALSGGMLKALGEMLADIHGQHDAQYLLKPINQLTVLDEFGEAQEAAQKFRELHQQLQELTTRRRELAASQTLRRQQLDLYEFQADEIDKAGVQPEELAQLESRHRVLSNVETIKRQAGAAYEALYDDEHAIVGRLKTITAVLLDLAQLHEELSGLSQEVRDAAVSLDDAAFTLRRIIDRLELDPGELSEVADRLNLLNRLIHKYGGHGAGAAELLAYREQIGKEIAELKSADESSDHMESQIANLEKQLALIGKELSRKRKVAAEKLVPQVHAHLAELGMKEARFHVEFVATPGDGQKDRTFHSPQGLETAEFMIAPNPGHPAAPLRKIASGGEMSRVMLALKSILAAADRVSVLVFDEIDANVGGRLGTTIGEKLRGLAAHHQVLCITHLPQIAAFADRQITIRKTTLNGESFTHVEILSGDQRVRELAEMITGKLVSETSLAQAKELLAAACSDKSRIQNPKISVQDKPARPQTRILKVQKKK